MAIVWSIHYVKRRDSEQSVIESVWAGGRNMDEQIESKCKCWLGRWSARGRQAVLAVVVVVGGWLRMMIVDCELTRDRTSFVSSAAAAWTTERTNEWCRQKTHSRTTGPGECKSN